MKTKLSMLMLCVAAAMLAACGGAANVNVNTSRMSNSAGNAANTVANTAANAANAVANTASSMTTAAPDSFMKDAAEGGLAEVELGKIAAKNAENPEVKKFGQMMVTEHTKANEELKALAAKKNVQLPAAPESYKSDIDSMSKMKGADFDRDYVDMMVDDHEATIADFEAQAKNSSDPDVKAFAEKSLPVLRKHLETIKAIQAKLK
jgi:putative membrane protein